MIQRTRWAELAKLPKKAIAFGRAYLLHMLYLRRKSSRSIYVKKRRAKEPPVVGAPIATQCLAHFPNTRELSVHKRSPKDLTVPHVRLCQYRRLAEVALQNIEYCTNWIQLALAVASKSKLAGRFDPCKILFTVLVGIIPKNHQIRLKIMSNAWIWNHQPEHMDLHQLGWFQVQQSPCHLQIVLPPHSPNDIHSHRVRIVDGAVAPEVGGTGRPCHGPSNHQKWQGLTWCCNPAEI